MVQFLCPKCHKNSNTQITQVMDGQVFTCEHCGFDIKISVKLILRMASDQPDRKASDNPGAVTSKTQ